MLAYADQLRLAQRHLSWPHELARLGDPGDAPLVQMQAAMVLAQTRVPADLARSLGLLQRVISNPTADAQPLQPLARLLARASGTAQVEDDRDTPGPAGARRPAPHRPAATTGIEALRAIERSFARPNAPAPSNGSKPAAP